MAGLGSGLLGLLDRRFTATVWLPTLVLWSALAALASAGPGWHRSVTWWTGQPVQVQLLLTVLALAWITFTASLTAGHLLGVLRLAEGYWPERGPLGRWRERRTKHYQDAVEATLKGPGTPGALPAGALGTDVPARLDRVMPTRLGNVLRAAEDHAEERYGIAAVVVWPRLYVVLPPTYMAALGAAKASLDLMATVLLHSVLFAVAGTVTASALLPWPVAVECLMGGVLLAWQAYEGAVHAARPYADLVRSAFDVYRPLLLDQLRMERASSWQAERRQWAQLSHLWAQGAPDGPEGARTPATTCPGTCTRWLHDPTSADPRRPDQRVPPGSLSRRKPSSRPRIGVLRRHRRLPSPPTRVGFRRPAPTGCQDRVRAGRVPAGT